MKILTDMKTWLSNCDNKTFKCVVAKHACSDHLRQCAADNCNDAGFLCKIEEAVDLGSGEWMLGLKRIDNDNDVLSVIEYYKLGDIQLATLTCANTLKQEANGNG